MHHGVIIVIIVVIADLILCCSILSHAKLNSLLSCMHAFLNVKCILVATSVISQSLQCIGKEAHMCIEGEIFQLTGFVHFKGLGFRGVYVNSPIM